jgi:hypothetical protein
VGVANTLVGLYYGWLAVTGGSAGIAIALGASALFSLAAGVGLLMRRRFGITALNFTLLLAVIEVVTDWSKPHEVGLLYYILCNVTFFAAIAATVVYFFKRWNEFSVPMQVQVALPAQESFPKLSLEEQKRIIHEAKARRVARGQRKI